MTSGLLRVAVVVVVVVSGLFAAVVVLGYVVVWGTPTPALIATSPTGVLPSPTRVPMPTDTAVGTAMSTATPTVRVLRTSTSTPSATPTLVPTETPAPTETLMPSSTPNPLSGIRFVDNEDCVDGISRELLPTMELVIEHGDASHLLVVEVADEWHERQQGLMCRDTVPTGSGMLFVFESASDLNFWMFNTYVPLDIVYLGDDKRVVSALRMEPCPRPEGVDSDAWRNLCSAASVGYGSGGLALYALELPAGWLASVGLELGNLEGVSVSW